MEHVGVSSGRSTSNPAEPTWKGFRHSTLAQFGITFEGDQVHIPYLTRAGEPYRTKVFTPTSSFWGGESKPQIPYGAETLKADGGLTIASSTIYVTEGESDALALRVAFPNSAVLGIPGASGWKPEWAKLLEPFGTVYLSFDGDEAGERLLRTVKADVPNYRAVLLPNGADTRAILQQLGRRAFNTLIELADRDYETRRAWANLDEAARRSEQVKQAWARASSG